MAELKEWIRGLVVLLVLASALELLLPMNSMKRFVRMAMGLLIVLGVVRPIVALLGMSIALDPDLLASPNRDLPTMNQIMAEADRFQERNHQLVLKEAEGRLTKAAQEAAKRVQGVTDAEVSLKLSKPQGGDAVQIERATVTLRLGSRFGQVRPVEPVRVQQGEGPEGPAAGATPPLAAEVGLVDQVRREVAQQLGLADLSPIQVLIERSGQPRR